MIVGFEGKLILGLIVGFALGYALQRGRFCVNTAFRDVVFVKDSTLLRAWAFAGLIQLVGVTALRSIGYFESIEIPPFFIWASIVGGFIFGTGMVIAGGCASGTCYRVSEGMLGSLMALIVFGITAVATDVGVLNPLQQALRSVRIDVNGAPATIDGALGVNTWVIVVPLVVLVGFWLLRGRKTTYHSHGWTWPITGAVIGLVGIAAWITSTATGRPFGLSITGPIRTWFRYIVEGDNSYLDWGAFMLIGLFVGAYAGAKLFAERKLRVPKPEKVVQSLVGGALMGFGAQVAGGCNIGHSFTGMSVLSVASLVTTVSIVLGGWTAVTIMFAPPKWLVALKTSVRRTLVPGRSAA